MLLQFSIGRSIRLDGRMVDTAGQCHPDTRWSSQSTVSPSSLLTTRRRLPSDRRSASLESRSPHRSSLDYGRSDLKRRSRSPSPPTRPVYRRRAITAATMPRVSVSPTSQSTRPINFPCLIDSPTAARSGVTLRDYSSSSDSSSESLWC